MPVHGYNKELVTMNLNPVVCWFKVAIGATGAVGTISQLKGNFVKSVVRNSAGNYTVTLNPPYPYSIVNIRANVNRAGVTDLDVRSDYDAATYSRTAGTFVIFCSSPTNSSTTTQLAADPPQDSELHVEVVFAGRKLTSD